MFVLWVTNRGQETAKRLASVRKDACILRYERKWVAEAFRQRRPLVFIGACGIAVRAVAPFLQHKSQDPPVLVIDESARFVISLLSGHLGGANALAQELAQLLGATPVITTASDLRGLPALDLWLRENDVLLDDWPLLKELQARLLERSLGVYLEPPLNLPLPQRLCLTSEAEADFVLTYRPLKGRKGFLVQALALGVGFHDHENALTEKVLQGLRKFDLEPLAVKYVATISRRQGNALEDLARTLQAEIRLFSPEELQQVKVPSPSKAQKALGLPGVAEPCALLAAEYGPLILRKQILDGVTLAVALRRKFVEEKP